MNATTATEELTLLDAAPPAQHPAPAPLPEGALSVHSPAGMFLAAQAQGISPEQIEKMLDLQERWERREAEKAFNDAMAAFKGEAVEIVKRKLVDYASKGGRTSYKHAELADVVEAVAPALSKHGFSWNWKTEQANGFIKVTCVLKHRLGHTDSATLSAPYDDSGGKNAIQAIISAKTYLERHTLKAVCGVSEKGEDDDGKGAHRSLLDTWVDMVNGTDDPAALAKISKDGAAAFDKAKDVQGYRAFAAEVSRRRRELQGAR